jgi:FkbM family methyltransferase
MKRSRSPETGTPPRTLGIVGARRLAHFVRKRIRARKLGVWLGRTRDFELPGRVIINGKPKRIYVPDDVGTRLVFLEVLIADCYRLGDVPQPVHTVLDIGANVGLFSLAARNAFPDATIHAYEPNGNLEQYLRAQAAVARCDYFMEAVGLDDGRVTLEFADRLGSTRSTPAPTGTIPSVAFRKTIERLGGTVDLVKVDCEGAEWEFLEDREAWKHVRNVTMEYHLLGEPRGRSHEDISRALTEIGFTVMDQDRFHESTGLIFASRQEASV